VTFALTACGSGDDEESISAVAGAAPKLAGLGDLATLHSPAVSETFGPAGGDLTLATGSTIEVSEGAFQNPTEVTVAIVDVETADPVKKLRVYHLSTEETIGPLGASVVLEVPQVADQVVVIQLQDDVWRALALSTGSAASLNISHFSSHYFGFAECSQFITLTPDGEASTDILDLARLVCGA
jgi:hypothetical protein